MAFVCDVDRRNNARGLYFRANKQAPTRMDDELQFTPIPNNVNWEKSVPVTLDQIKLSMRAVSPSLKFWCTQTAVGPVAIHNLHAFYAA